MEFNKRFIDQFQNLSDTFVTYKYFKQCHIAFFLAFPSKTGCMNVYYFTVIIANLHSTFYTYVLGTIGAVTTFGDNTGFNVKAEPKHTTA